MAAIRVKSNPVANGEPGLEWLRELMEQEGVSQKDVAKAWEVSESSVSRWLDGLQASDIPVGRIVTFSRLVRRPIEEMLTRLGYNVWRPSDADPGRPLQPISGPPIPTTSLRPARRPGWFYLLLHLELSARNVAAIIATLEEEGGREMAEAARRRLDSSGAAQVQSIRLRLSRARGLLGSLEAHLKQLSPLSILDRGYAIVEREGKVVKSAALPLKNLLGLKRSSSISGRGLSGGQKPMKIYHELRSERGIYPESPGSARLLRKPIAPSDYSAPGFVSVIYGEGQMEARLGSLD
jgi:transcriptional regulator with XRE-family HTH domain